MKSPQAAIPHLTRSGLHRLFQRHRIRQLPSAVGDKPRKQFNEYPIGCVSSDLHRAAFKEKA